MKINAIIMRDAARYVTEYLSLHLKKEYCYHAYSHTVEVVSAAEKIASELNLSKDETRILVTAAWFHDTGYTKSMENHEMAGTSIAENFLKEKKVDETEIEKVKACIMATQYPQEPQSLIEQILCDADLAHLGNKTFFEKSELLRREWMMTKNINYADVEWYQLNYEFITNHKFHTDYCREEYGKRKSKNERALKQKIEDLSNDPKQKTRNEKLEKGVETLFKNTSQNHMRLSSMAVNKAHILLSINSIIISIVLSVLGKKLVDNPYLVLPTIMLIIVCLVTIVYAVLTTKPKITHGIFTKEQINKKEANLMFFGNFHQMEMADYEWGVQELMYDKDYLYKSMTRDIYFLGKVLAVKYRRLHIGYNIFMYGLITTVVTFGICIILSAH